ncbi:MAG: ADP-ribosylglycohydrolase family protein, partial [Dehalococcoidia bacterium]
MSDLKTSFTDPLRIDFVPAGPTGGAIGMTLCPGKHQTYGHTGSWQRDLAIDLGAIRDSGAVALVSLMEGAELEGVQVHPGSLQAGARALGLEWHHLPVRDVSVPDDAFEDGWAYAGPRLHDHLRCGRRIVVHCLGGLGRTGTVAARLLIEGGVDPDVAIRAVRVARPGAIETLEQERYVRQCRATRVHGGALSLAERAVGCLLGGAVGDAFGYAVEFDRLDRIRSRFGPDGIHQPVLTGGSLVVSDDTQMTLF